jgi:hypothetical protein
MSCNNTQTVLCKTWMRSANFSAIRMWPLSKYRMKTPGLHQALSARMGNTIPTELYLPQLPHSSPIRNLRQICLTTEQTRSIGILYIQGRIRNFSDWGDNEILCTLFCPRRNTSITSLRNRFRVYATAGSTAGSSLPESRLGRPVIFHMTQIRNNWNSDGHKRNLPKAPRCSRAHGWWLFLERMAGGWGAEDWNHILRFDLPLEQKPGTLLRQAVSSRLYRVIKTAPWWVVACSA